MTDAWYMESLSQMTGILNKLPAAIFTLAVGAVVVKAIRFITGRATVVARLDPTLGTLLQSVVGFAGWVFVLVIDLPGETWEGIAWQQQARLTKNP
jgi:hypothetical protein